MIKTKRLLLRQWVEEDFQVFAQICKDKDVMEFFPKLQSRAESYEMAHKIQSLIEDKGWGFWAVEVPTKHKYIGFVGLHCPEVDLPFSPCVEIGWRLSKQHWGKGYATEAAKAVIEYAFTHLNLEEIVSFTTLANTRSIAVMQKIGMFDTIQNFKHPNIDALNPICEHVLYKISQDQWKQQNLC